jgi:hypothetical protein
MAFINPVRAGTATNPNAAERAFYGDNLTVVKALAFSFYMAFRISDNTYWSKEDQALLTHPMSNVRAAYTIQLFEQNLPFNLHGAVTAEEVAQASMESVIEVERACALMRDDSIDARGIQAVFGRADEYRDCLRSWHDEWSVIRPQLERLKRGSVLP